MLYLKAQISCFEDILPPIYCPSGTKKAEVLMNIATVILFFILYE